MIANTIEACEYQMRLVSQALAAVVETGALALNYQTTVEARSHKILGGASPEIKQIFMFTLLSQFNQRHDSILLPRLAKSYSSLAHSSILESSPPNIYSTIPRDVPVVGDPVVFPDEILQPMNMAIFSPRGVQTGTTQIGFSVQKFSGVLDSIKQTATPNTLIYVLSARVKLLL
ncbi:hypothetical protein M427DRAFT_44687 [Gonapodya prolifera JEL478]|uniref:Uncharacterized protein n=1 Tax=Gonapodya prolifera (strain JEL478) TaxID=1344416 RepID=A0A139ADM6_GONPJ|nr:hypothetical protein M427DRAFT_44687 [Gonapodya prolifera JEL478]|eukprot:KXS14922.1 hypothetical protein M427DRAFT_44687 [Gonapodya prolifera JEL478]